MFSNKSSEYTPLISSSSSSQLQKVSYSSRSIQGYLPKHVIVQILSPLDGETIGKAAQACSYFNRVAQDLPHYIQWKGEVKTRIKLREERAREPLIKLCTTILRWVCFARVHEWMFMLSLTLFYILVPLKLEKVINWSWAWISLALFVPLFQLLLAPIAYIVASSICKYKDFDERLEAKEGTKHNVHKAFVSPYMISYFNKNGSRKQVLHYFTLFLSPLASLSMLLLRLTDTLNLSWWIILAPWLLFSTCLAAVPTAFAWVRCKYWIASVTILMYAFWVLLALKLEEIISFSWTLVISPLIAYSSILIFISILLAIPATSKFNVLWSSTESVPHSSLLIPILVIFPLLLWTLFEVLLMLRLDGYSSISFPIIFTPLFVLNGSCISFMAFFDFIVCLD